MFAPRPTRSQRIKRRLDKQAVRQQKLRNENRERMRPETHVTHSALVEAIAYVTECHHPEGMSRRDISVSFVEIQAAAVTILVAKGYDAQQASLSVDRATKVRAPKNWTLSPPGTFAFVPKVRPNNGS